MKTIILALWALFGGVEETDSKDDFYSNIEWTCETDQECMEECILAADEMGLDSDIYCD